MPTRRPPAARKGLPAVLRRAVHDLNQPLQAVRMMVEIPGVIAEDSRGIPQKLGGALTELEARLAQIGALARALDADADAEPVRAVGFAEVVALARRIRPEIWERGDAVRVGNPGAIVRVPPRAAAWCLNSLVDNARRARARRIVVGPRAGWIVVGDDGGGMSRAMLAQMRRALGGGDGAFLGVGLALASALVATWGGGWRADSTEGRGTCIGFSTPAPRI